MEMPPIRNLHRLRRASAGSHPIRLPTVAADDLDPRVRLEPSGEVLVAAPRQEIDHGMALQIHQDRGIGASLPARKLVNAQHTWGRAGCWGMLPEQLQQGRG